MSGKKLSGRISTIEGAKSKPAILPTKEYFHCLKLIEPSIPTERSGVSNFHDIMLFLDFACFAYIMQRTVRTPKDKWMLRYGALLSECDGGYNRFLASIHKG